MDANNHQVVIARMIKGGVAGFVFAPSIVFLYLIASGFFNNNCCPEDFDYWPINLWVFAVLLFWGSVGSVIGCLLSLFSKKWTNSNL